MFCATVRFTIAAWRFILMRYFNADCVFWLIFARFYGFRTPYNRPPWFYGKLTDSISNFVPFPNYLIFSIVSALAKLYGIDGNLSHVAR